MITIILMHLAAGMSSICFKSDQLKARNPLIEMSAGALAAAGVEQDDVTGMCLGMSGVDREADASALKACLQEWLPQEARLLHAVKHTDLSCGHLLASSHTNLHGSIML